VRTTVLLAGVDDDETRTDTIMLACLNSVTNDINLISIPRDTLIKLTPEGYLEIQEHSSGKLSKELKVNAIHSKAGKEFGMEALRNELERQLDIDIDYYAKVNCEAFRYIVDSIGGIEFNVEKRLYYSDPTQNLYIDLKPGLQHLDGDKAEQLVRCRYSYARQDLERVEVQQKFLKEFFKKALSTDTIMSNPGVYLNTIINYVTTDMGITDMIKYAKYAKNISVENTQGYTLPGEPETIDGISYYIMDKNETDKMMYDIFKSESSEQDNENKGESSKGKSIQILTAVILRVLPEIQKQSLKKKDLQLII
jgi:LCP family protein required for cell wall assembly